MIIPIGTNYTATMSGRLPKLVKCTLCGIGYVYLLERTASGASMSFMFLDEEGARARAAAQAEEVLRKRLEREIDVVPCPACGHVQPEMIPQARKLRLRWLKIAGIVFLPIAAILFVFAMVAASSPRPAGGSTAELLWLATACAALCVPGLPMLKFALCYSYDPNAEDVEARKSLGQSRALTQEAFVKFIHEQPA